MLDFIKSPLNYTGNKSRILNQILPLFPKKINVMVDIFCGGATVGLNVDCKKVYFVDANERIIGLLKILSQFDFEKLLSKLETIINKYKLSYSYKYGYANYRKECGDIKDNNGLKDYNKVGFEALKKDYNDLKNKDSKKAYLMLYVLMVYAFNNDIRFNSRGEFNLPIGKTDLNKNNVMKLKKYIERTKSKECSFICSSFSSEDVKKILDEADFVYMDPPYIVGDAVYNSGWTKEKEKELLSFISSLIERKVNFAFSNVTEKIGKANTLLLQWINDNQSKIEVNNIIYNYKSSSYNKKIRDAKEKEVLVVNRSYSV